MIDEQGKKHYKFGGSSIERVAYCPGSIRAIEELGTLPKSSAATRGTRIHERVEHLLKYPVTNSKLEADEENIAQLTYKAILELCAEHGLDAKNGLIEQTLLLPEFHPTDAGTTPDWAGYLIFGDLLVIDYKFGYNYVDHTNSYQLSYCACAVMQNLDPFVRASIQNVHMVILQPYDGDLHPRKWTISASELSQYESYFKGVIERVEQNPDLRLAGEHCEAKYCPARTSCGAYHKWLDEKSAGAFLKLLDGEEQKPGRGERLARQLKVLDLFDGFKKAVLEEAKQVLMADPTAIPGWSLSDTQGNRSWLDPAEVKKKAKELGLKPTQFMTSTLLSPAQFEKLLKTSKIDFDISGMVTRPYTGVKLVEKPATDLAELIVREEQNVSRETGKVESPA